LPLGRLLFPFGSTLSRFWPFPPMSTSIAQVHHCWLGFHSKSYALTVSIPLTLYNPPAPEILEAVLH
jgi:hypothetical protein